MHSPLHETDEHEEPVPETPLQEPPSFNPNDVAQNAQILGNELRHVLRPLEVQITNFITQVSTRLNTIGRLLKEQGVRIVQLEIGKVIGHIGFTWRHAPINTFMTL